MALARRPYYLKVSFLHRRRAHFQQRVFFACCCTFRLAVVIRVRPAPSFDQYGLLTSTACTFLRRLMFILFWYLLRPARLCGGRPLLGRLGCLRAAPGPPSGGPTPRGTPRRRFGSSRVVSWKSPDLIWEASRPPKAPQSRSRDRASWGYQSSTPYAQTKRPHRKPFCHIPFRFTISMEAPHSGYRDDYPGTQHRISPNHPRMQRHGGGRGEACLDTASGPQVGLPGRFSARF